MMRILEFILNIFLSILLFPFYLFFRFFYSSYLPIDFDIDMLSDWDNL